MKLLEEMCNIHAPSGEESNMTKFILKYVEKHQKNWHKKPIVYHGDGFQDNIILVYNIYVWR